MDHDGTGSISVSELGALLEKMDVRLSSHELADVIERYDENDDGQLGFEEFSQIVSLQISEADIEKAFRSVDADGSGRISKAEMLGLLTSIGADPTLQMTVLAHLPPSGCDLNGFRAMVESEVRPHSLPRV